VNEPLLLDFGTLPRIINAEKESRRLLGPSASAIRADLEQTLRGLTVQQFGQLCVALNALKDNVRVLSLCTIQPTGRPPQ
jgi:hypothetical protein